MLTRMYIRTFRLWYSWEVRLALVLLAFVSADLSLADESFYDKTRPRIDFDQGPVLSPSKLATQQMMQAAVANVLGNQSFAAQRKSCAADTFAGRQSMAARPSMMRKSTSAGPWVDPAAARQSYGGGLRQSVAPNMRQSVAPASMRMSVSPNMRMSVSPNMRMSVSPNMRMSVAPADMRQSMAPSMRQSMAPNMRQSMAPSMRQSMAPDDFRQSMAPDAFRQSLSPAAFGVTQSFGSGMDSFGGFAEPRRYCAQGRYVGPGADINMDALSTGSQRHSAFGEEPIYSNLDIMRQLMEPPTTDYTEDDNCSIGNPDAELQTDEENNSYVLNDDDGEDGVYEVIIDQVPDEHGASTNRISIISSGGAKDNKKANNPGPPPKASPNVTKTTSCSRLGTTKSDMSTQIRDARLNPQPTRSKTNQATVKGTTKEPKTHNVAPQRTASTKSLLKPSPSNRSIDPNKPKSQVHFDINILDANNNNRMIVLRRSISQQTKT